MTYRVEAHRSDGWWALEFPEVDRRIHSQVRRLDQAAATGAEAITLWFADEDERQVHPDEIEVVAMLDDAYDDDVHRAVELRQRAAEVGEEAQRWTRIAIGRCLASGLTTRDIGSLLDVSHQYVARVAHEEQLV